MAMLVITRGYKSTNSSRIHGMSPTLPVAVNRSELVKSAGSKEVHWTATWLGSFMADFRIVLILA